MAEVSGDIQVSGFVEKQAMFEHLLTTDPRFDLNTRAVIRNVLQEARKKVSKDAASYIDNDPRKAARAIKHTVYKQIFGGNISILQKRKIIISTRTHRSTSQKKENKYHPKLKKNVGHKKFTTN
jgi:hypothetical protein